MPKDALVQGPQGWTVYVAEGDAAQPHPVTLGSAIEDRLEITSGLSAGDVVVTRGNERLRPGQTISYEPLAGAPASAEEAGERPEDTSGTGAAADAAQEG